MTPVISIVTIDSIDKAKGIARQLVEEKLVACVNIIPQIASIYSWDNQICEEDEIILLMKTEFQLVDKLEARVIELHPYDTPEFVVLRVDHINEKYGKWLESCVN